MFGTGWSVVPCCTFAQIFDKLFSRARWPGMGSSRTGLLALTGPRGLFFAMSTVNVFIYIKSLIAFGSFTRSGCMLLLRNNSAWWISIRCVLISAPYFLFKVRKCCKVCVCVCVCVCMCVCVCVLCVSQFPMAHKTTAGRGKRTPLQQDITTLILLNLMKSKRNQPQGER